MNDPTPGAAPVAPRGWPPLRAWRRHAWLRRGLIGVAGVLVALLLFVTFALPGIVRSQAERIVGEKLHRPLTIARVDIHPFALGVSVYGLHLMELDGQTVFIAFDRLDVRLSPASLLHLAPVIREVHLVKPYARFVRRGPHQYSTDDIVAALNAAPHPPPDPDAPPLRFSVNNIQIDDGRFVFDDMPIEAHHEVAKFSLGLPFVSNFSADEEVFVEPHLAAVVDGAPLRLTAEARPFAATREAAIDLDFDGVDLTRYLDYVPDPPVHLPTGTMDMHLKAKVRLARDQPPAVALSGTVTLKTLDIRSTVGKPLVKFDELALALDKASFPSGPLAATLTVNHKGRIALSGDTAAAPLHAALDVAIDDLDLLPLQPLIADRVNLRVTHAALAVKGHVLVDRPADGALHGGFTGDVAIPAFATIDSLNANDFVGWNRLALRGIKVDFAPLAVQVVEVDLDKLYARVIISPNGRINLQDVVRAQAAPKISLTEATPAAPAAPVKAAAPVPPAAPPPAGPPVSIGKVLVTGGHVRFSDNFIKPRYSADLLDLNGTVTGLSSDPASRADIDVRGKVNDAPLLIGGHVNPLARDLALDIKASVHDMELAPLSPYSAKYVGYRIERGKMSFDVAYQLENRELHAQNRLVLDQLTFGDKVESPTATSLPVQLAIALLKDRNGVIDIDLPIGGSLDDPDFSVGGLIVKVLINLVTKAVTAPFALIGNLFGGSSEELSSLAFDAGKADVPASREESLKSLAKALAERPGLRLDITGWADPAADRAALRDLRMQARLRALKRQDLAARGNAASQAEVVVTPAEYPGLLERAYQLDVVGKGAGPAGAPAAAAAGAKSPPPSPAAMEQALRDAQVIDDDDLRSLGNRRAQAAKDWLRTIGLVPEERLSLVGAKIGSGDAAPPGALRVEFGLR